MRNFIVLILMLFTKALTAAEWEDEKVFSIGTETKTLRILSSTDTIFFEPIIKSFIKR